MKRSFFKRKDGELKEQKLEEKKNEPKMEDPDIEGPISNFQPKSSTVKDTVQNMVQAEEAEEIIEPTFDEMFDEEDMPRPKASQIKFDEIEEIVPPLEDELDDRKKSIPTEEPIVKEEPVKEKHKEKRKSFFDRPKEKKEPVAKKEEKVVKEKPVKVKEPRIKKHQRYSIDGLVENQKSRSRYTQKKLLLNLLEIACIIGVVVSSIKVYNWYTDNKENAELMGGINNSVSIVDEVDEETQETKSKYQIDFAGLKSQNSDTVGWLKVNNTNIEYPVVKYKDNDYYLTHNFSNAYNAAGWVFADYRNKYDGTDKNLIIYGHNRLDGTMFGSLKKTLTSEWYDHEENYDIVFITDGEYSIYRVFSVYQVQKEDVYTKTDFSGSEFQRFINLIKSRSLKDFGTEVTANDHILTLSTCSSNNNFRRVLHAKKVTEQ